MTDRQNTSVLTEVQLDALARTLSEDKQWLEHHLQNTEHEGLGNSLGFQTGELSAYDNHPADLGTEMFERGKDLALHENAERHLTDVNEALERIADGVYGLCRACGQSIPYDRLQALPTASYCVDHVPDPFVSNKRPVEEKFLGRPFGRTSLDERDDQNQFDGEDAWQIVEQWGTSNTPAMAEDPNVSDSYNEMQIEADEADGYVEAYESFVATDLYGRQVSIVRNQAYRHYLNNGEGDGLLEPDSLDVLDEDLYD